MRGPATDALVEPSVICCPTTGAMLLSNASMNASTWRRSLSNRKPVPRPAGGMPENAVPLRKRNMVSVLPSCRKPKPRIWSPLCPLSPGTMIGTGAMPNIPIF
jgi:hypothetical protein